MTNLRTAAQQALEALNGLSEDAVCQSSHHAKKDRHTSLDVCPVFLRLRAAITALQAALEEPVQEPVAWMVYTLDGKSVCVTDNPTDCGSKHKALPLYTAPPQRKPLTDEEILEAVGWERAEMYMKLTPNFPVEEARKETLKNARAVEAKHNIKE